MSDLMRSLSTVVSGLAGTPRALNIAVLSVTDTAVFHYDKPGSELADLILASGHELADHACVHDDDAAICHQVQAWIDSGMIDVILTADISTFSAGKGPPDIILVSDLEGIERSSEALHHPVIGCIGVINLLTPLRLTPLRRAG